MSEATPTEALKKLLDMFGDGAVSRVMRGKSNATEQQMLIAALQEGRAKVAEAEKA